MRFHWLSSPNARAAVVTDRRLMCGWPASSPVSRDAGPRRPSRRDHGSNRPARDHGPPVRVFRPGRRPLLIELGKADDADQPAPAAPRVPRRVGSVAAACAGPVSDAQADADAGERERPEHRPAVQTPRDRDAVPTLARRGSGRGSRRARARRVSRESSRSTPARPASRAFAIDEAGGRPRVGVPRVPAALPPARAGSSTTRGHLVGDRRDAGRGRRPGRRGRRDGRRHRHHEPTRDGRRVGPHDGSPVPPGHRLAGPSHRARAATSSTTAGLEPIGPRPHRPRARPLLLGDEARVALRHGGVEADADLAFGTVDSWLLWQLTGGPGPAACTRPTRRTRAARCCTTSARCEWSDELLRAVRRAARVPARGAPEQRPLRRDRSRGRRRPRGPGERDRRRPAGGALRPGLLRARHGEEHLRHRLVRAREPRLDAPRARRRPAHDAWRGRSAAPRRTRWRARSSSPARRSSGCATGSASSPTPPRPARSRRQRPRHRRGVLRARVHRARARRTGIPYARGAILGLTRGTGRAHLARAVVEAMAFQTARRRRRDDGRERGTDSPSCGSTAARASWTCSASFQADLLGVPVRRPAVAGDDRARRGLPRRARGGRLGVTGGGRGRVAFRRRVHARHHGRRPRPPPPALVPRSVERSRGWATSNAPERAVVRRLRCNERRDATFVVDAWQSRATG